MLLCGNTKLSGSDSWKSNFVNKTGNITFEIDSIKVLPKQILIPPRKGLKANGLRFSPFGVRNSSFYGSKRSGKNSSGLIH